MFRVRGHDLQSVWSATVGTPAGWLYLTAVLSADGATISLLDVAPGACGGAIDEYSRKGIDSVFGPALLEGCKGRGEFTWKGQRYVRSAGPPPDPDREDDPNDPWP